MPFWAPWDFSWSEFLAAALGLWWYGRGVARCPVHVRPAAWRQASFVLGVVAIYTVVQTRFDYMAQHEFFMNRIQHIFMHHLGPYLIALAWPGEALQRGLPVALRRITSSRILRGVLSVVQQPFPAGLLFVGLIYLFLIPEVQFQAMIDPRLYTIMNWTMIGDGLLFWILVLDPRPKEQAGISYGMRLVLPFAVMFPQIALGAYIAFGPDDLYRYYDLCGRFFASIPSATDQHIGGLVAWIPAGMMSAVGFMTVLNALRIYEDNLPPIEDPEDEEDSPTRIVVYASSWTGRR
ncbi:MAG TPA: cytochrome c oxidase assembly protein [Acetobacteraceae bacterium]|nr:cytochrome c oxidase assembly protein [Acetobacteraceae bacterium]